MSSRRLPLQFLFCLSFIQAVALVVSALRHSPTYDEPAHVAAGIWYWKSQSTAMYRVNPPLVQALSAVPSMIVGHNEDWSGFHTIIGARPEFGVGKDFVSVNGRRVFFLTSLARIACLPFALLGTSVCFLWGRDLFGSWCGLLSGVLWASSPLVLGCGSLAVPDVPAAAIGLTTCYVFWKWLIRPRIQFAIATSILIGLAQLTKITMILLFVILPLMWLAMKLTNREARSRSRILREAITLFVMFAISIYIINVGYHGRGTFLRLDQFEFVSDTLGSDEITRNRFANSWIAGLRIPLPYDYVVGIDEQQYDFEHMEHQPSYLRGKFQETGWWYYYLYAILVKVPVGTLMLAIASVLYPFFSTSSNPRCGPAWIVLIPSVTFFVVASAKCGFSHHVRYILPAAPFAFIWMGQTAMLIPETIRLRFKSRVETNVSDVILEQPKVSPFNLSLGCIVVVAILLAQYETWRVFPHHLSFFNVTVGGPERGAEHLLMSNIDWGQDLLHLERWIRQNDVSSPVYLAFYNSYNPFELGIRGLHEWPFTRQARFLTNRSIPSGFYAISVNLLYDFPWHIPMEDSSRVRVDPSFHQALRRMEPVGTAGYSIRIYSSDQVLAAMRDS